MGCEQQPGQHGVVYGVGAKMTAHIAAREDGAVDGIAFGVFEGVFTAGMAADGIHRISPCDRKSRSARPCG